MSYSYVKINKTLARKMYNSSYPIKLFACRVNGLAVLENEHYMGFLPPVTIQLVTSKYKTKCFDSDVAEFEFYNCNNELGKYAHFYVDKESFDRFKKK